MFDQLDKKLMRHKATENHLKSVLFLFLKHLGLTYQTKVF